MKTLLYRFFGIGKIPAPLLASLEQEGILLLDEGIRGSATYTNFRSPNRISSWKRQWFTASIILTNARLAALSYSKPAINISLTDERLGALQCSLETSTTLRIGFDAALFHDDWSGMIDYRFRTPQAQLFLEQLRKRMIAAASHLKL